MAKAPLGIMLLETTFPRIPGDVGSPLSYSFPVKLRTVNGATVLRAVYQADPELLEDFRNAAKELEAQGAAAITSSCGFLSPLQAEVARAVSIPVFLSSLMQVPLAHAMMAGRVAILTANSDRLTGHVLAHAGITADIPIAIAGLQNARAFSDPILSNTGRLDKRRIEVEVVSIAKNLLDEYADIACFVFECHNLTPYAKAVQSLTGKPVFDIITFAEWVYASVCKRDFPDGDG